MCEKRHDRFEKSVVSVRLNACPDYVMSIYSEKVRKASKDALKGI